MIKKLLVSVSIITIMSGYIVDASAASFRERDLEARLGRMEYEMRKMRKDGNQSPDNSTQSPRANADAQVKISEMEEQMRRLRGDLERSQHENDRLKNEMKSLSSDLEYRLKALENNEGGSSGGGSSFGAIEVPPMEGENIPSPTESVSKPTPSPEPVAKVNRPAPKMEIKIRDPKTIEKSLEAPMARPIKKPAIPVLAEDGKVIAKVTPNTNKNKSLTSYEVPRFTSAREHYNYAFTLMNKAQYSEAGQVFDSFLQRYPDNELEGNVYYWLGETFYVQENYAAAADSFRQGFEEMPKGRKAPDNLLKLSMSLRQLDQTNEACIVLEQLVKKYNSPETVLQKAKQQSERYNCQKI